jgi:integrase/recombinase XerD
MASIRYRRKCKRWEVRRSVKDPLTGKTRHLCRLMPPNCTRYQAQQLAADFNRQASQIRQARFNPSAAILTAQQVYLQSWQTHPAESIRHYTFTLQLFLSSLPPDIGDITQITPLHITAFVHAVLSAGSKARTANAKLTVIKSFCRWCSKIYRIPNASSAVDFLPEEPPVRRILTEAELAAILADVTPNLRDRLLFLANTGLRATELCTLTWSMIAVDKASLCLVGKKRKVRVVPLNSACRDILARLSAATPQPDCYVFMSKSTHPLPNHILTRSGLYNTCKKIADRLLIPDFGPHSFRHYFATKMITSGVPLAIVSKILGHSSVTTTERIYMHIMPAHLAGATECLVPAPPVTAPPQSSPCVDKTTESIPASIPSVRFAWDH